MSIIQNYRRVWGAGPRGAIVAMLMFAFFKQLKIHWPMAPIFESDLVRLTLACFAFLLTAVLLMWSLLSLPVRQRGRQLVTGGCFRYFRHPLYAAFVSFFNFGLAVLLNSWYFVVWAVVTHLFFHLNVRSEERFMLSLYGSQYAGYCRKTGRFFPKLFPVD